jgi:TonB-dependent SusC/RagA subfamily outer membrane receptor
MENHDKLFNQIKTAAENAETKDFPSMESVWSRVEGKLDKKVLKKENTLWKKIAVAASVLLFFSIGYQYLTSEKKIVAPKKDIVTIDTTKAITPNIINGKEEVASSLTVNPAIKENPNQILDKQIATQNQIVINNNYTFSTTKEEEKGVISTDSLTINGGYYSVDTKTKSNWYGNRKFNSRGVEYDDNEQKSTNLGDNKNRQEIPKKQDPLIVIDDSTKDQEISKIDPDDIDSIDVLANPLYIINGVYYTEKELFGPKPTSPYAPLSKLEIETITVLKDKEATAIYGEKGKEGVVIITTKTGKPTFKKP